MKKIVIIPAYNEISNIEFTVNDIQTNAPGFDYVIINEDVEKSVDMLHNIVRSEKIKGE